MKKTKVLFTSFVMLGINLFAEQLSDGSYYIVSKHSGECLEVDKSEVNVKAVLSKCEDISEQKFVFNNIENNKFTIANIIIGQDSDSNGTHLYSSNNSEEFIIEKSNPLFSKIKVVNSKKYVTAIPYSNNVVQYQKHSSDDQEWMITTDYDLINRELVECNGRECYSNEEAINNKIAMNTDNTILLFDGKFWHKENDINSLVDSGNSYLSRDSVDGFSLGTNLYFDNNNPASGWTSANQFCINKGWRLASKSEVSVDTNGIISPALAFTSTYTGGGSHWYFQRFGGTPNSTVTNKDYGWVSPRYDEKYHKEPVCVK